MGKENKSTVVRKKNYRQFFYIAIILIWLGLFLYFLPNIFARFQTIPPEKLSALVLGLAVASPFLILLFFIIAGILILIILYKLAKRL